MSEDAQSIMDDELKDISGGMSRRPGTSGPVTHTFVCRDCKNVWRAVTEGSKPNCPKCGSSNVGYPAGGFSGPRGRM
ncbi:MAG: hypothetical protein IKG18_14535 [Atopobiaceae bacterium]|nr:hypothetical protein [Atopobiaceae bacterium]